MTNAPTLPAPMLIDNTDPEALDALPYCSACERLLFGTKSVPGPSGTGWRFCSANCASELDPAANVQSAAMYVANLLTDSDDVHADEVLIEFEQVPQGWLVDFVSLSAGGRYSFEVIFKVMPCAYDLEAAFSCWRDEFAGWNVESFEA